MYIGDGWIVKNFEFYHGRHLWTFLYECVSATCNFMTEKFLWVNGISLNFLSVVLFWIIQRLLKKSNNSNSNFTVIYLQIHLFERNVSSNDKVSALAEKNIKINLLFLFKSELQQKIKTEKKKKDFVFFFFPTILWLQMCVYFLTSSKQLC